MNNIRDDCCSNYLNNICNTFNMLHFKLNKPQLREFFDSYLKDNQFAIISHERIAIQQPTEYVAHE